MDSASTAPVVATPASAGTPKDIHSLVVDTGPLIKNDPPISSLLARATQLYTIPSVLEEVRDAHTRSRLQNLMPFLQLRNPRKESLAFVSGFARKTGDLEVLSKPDLHLLALAYELDCERHGGDERLRKDPSQTSTNVPVLKQEEKESKAEDNKTEEVPAEALEKLSLEGKAEETQTKESVEEKAEEDATEEPSIDDEVGDDSDDEGGWITPSNLKKRMDEEKGSLPTDEVKFMEAALLTTDFAMQNVALRIGLHILSSSMHRITTVKTFILRCHGCFATTKDMTKQFCPRCGQPTLLRTSCATNADGTFKLFLKKNFQWNNRGNVYSIPKPVHGSSNGKLPKNLSVGGQKGWGRDLILAEDQKEYVKASTERRRQRQRDLMDEDYLPSILTGERKNSSGRVRIGAGRNVNSKKRR
ncbi:hypothetical protein TD95_003414 [Thielaviopsis punctulata]|uniref:20S-pre-rRNA D-site endonuclease NOB1 n=1 Tax=Thielaviopsis punctulata TaxID=72032 RepID=A0A0F4Z7R7_9PEZI|nr:hypothetical protein TD95_003414 [Thielaviopsis punctulata]